MPHPIIWPHRFFESLSAHRSDIWRQRILGSDGAMQQFWENIRDTEFIRKHKYLPESVWPSTVPLGMHGDGGAFNKQDSLYTFAWNSLVSTSTTAQTKFLFTVIRKSDIASETIDELMGMLGWSFNVLLSGEKPTADYLNRPLEGRGHPCQRHTGMFGASAW